MRGATLFTDILFQEPPIPEKQVKGRSDILIAKRNECLADRYYFYRKSGFSYDVVLTKLSLEFFLSVVTIPQIMEKPENQTYLHKLKTDQPTKSSFQKKWPHLSWF